MSSRLNSVSATLSDLLWDALKIRDIQSLCVVYKIVSDVSLPECVIANLITIREVYQHFNHGGKL